MFRALLREIKTAGRNLPDGPSEVIAEHPPQAALVLPSQTLLQNCMKYFVNNIRYFSEHPKSLESMPLAVRAILLEFAEEYQQVHNETLQLLCSPLITKITLFRCQELTGEGLSFIADQCPNLKDLTIKQCMGIQEDRKAFEGMVHIATSCLQLTHLCFSWNHLIEDKEMVPIINALASNKDSQLQHLSLRGCRLLSDGTLASLTTAASSLKSLRSIDLGWNQNFNSVALMSLFSAMEELFHIDLGWCGKTEDLVLFAISNHHQNLIYLNLETCKFVSDAGVTAIAEKCTKMKFLRLKNTALLTDESGIAIADYCKQLRILNLAGCNEITDGSITTIAANCKYLERISLSGVIKITDVSVDALLQYCPNLSQVDLSNCPLVSVTSRSALGEKDVSSQSQQKLDW